MKGNLIFEVFSRRCLPKILQNGYGNLPKFLNIGLPLKFWLARPLNPKTQATPPPPGKEAGATPSEKWLFVFNTILVFISLFGHLKDMNQIILCCLLSMKICHLQDWHLLMYQGKEFVNEFSIYASKKHFISF